MRRLVPNFVILSALFATCLTACQRPIDQNKALKSKEAAGVNSKIGKAISTEEMCALPVIDSNGRTTVASLVFQKNSVLVRRLRVMDTKSMFTIEKESRSNWSLFGDSLLITENGSTVKNTIQVYPRESDQASCMRFTELEDRPEYCACSFSKSIL